MLHRLAILLACPLLLVDAAPAKAGILPPEDICLPTANPHPDWWSPGLTAQQREARWKYASVRKNTWGTRAARVRAVWSQPDTIYVEVQVSGDNSLDDDDAFVMAISDAAQTLPELYVELHPLEDCPVWTDCDGAGVPLDPASILFSEGSSSATSLTWSPLSSTNPSDDFAIEHPWVVTAATGSTYIWTLSFALTVPTEAGGEFADRLFYGNAIAYDPGITSGTYYEMPLWCTPSSVSTNDCTIYSGPAPELPFDLPWGAMLDTWPLVEAGACEP